MKIKLLLFLLLSNLCFSQIKFEPGYYKDNAGTVVKCLIKNMDWLNNPTFIEIKISENDVVIKKTIGEISEFKVDGNQKYIRATVDVDDFVDDLKTLTDDPFVTISKKTLFLKVENEGLANFYSYVNDNFKKFFFSKANEPIQLLIFKKYFIFANGIEYNNSFRQLLSIDLNLTSVLEKKLQRTRYNLDDLNDFFETYNNNKVSNIASKTNSNYKKINFNIKVGAVFNSYKVEGGTFNLNFPSQSNFGFGFEIEHVFNFNNNKWSIYFEPFYETFSSTFDDSKNGTSTVALKILNLGFGAKHKMYLNKNSLIFINLGLQMVNNLGDKVVDSGITQQLQLTQTTFNVHGGFGFKFQNKYSIEYRLRGGNNLLQNYAARTSIYSSSALVLGYTIF